MYTVIWQNSGSPFTLPVSLPVMVLPLSVQTSPDFNCDPVLLTCGSTFHYLWKRVWPRVYEWSVCVLHPMDPVVVFTFPQPKNQLSFKVYSVATLHHRLSRLQWHRRCSPPCYLSRSLLDEESVAHGSFTSSLDHWSHLLFVAFGRLESLPSLLPEERQRRRVRRGVRNSKGFNGFE